VGSKTENLQFTNSGITEISKIIFYDRFLIFAIILELEYILILGDKNIINYLNNLILYINKINLKFDKKLQSIIKNRGEYLLL
jgi:hypothetical protein